MAGEVREWMVRYESEDAEYLGSEERPCLFRTAQCPDHCAHAQTVYSFKTHHLKVEVNGASSHAKWVTPQEQGYVHHLTAKQLTPAHLSIVKELVPGARVLLHWHHDYVTISGASGPQYPVVKLEKK